MSFAIFLDRGTGDVAEAAGVEAADEKVQRPKAEAFKHEIVLLDRHRGVEQAGDGAVVACTTHFVEWIG